MDLGIGTLGVVIIIVLLYALSSIKILAEYERGVIFALADCGMRPRVPA